MKYTSAIVARLCWDVYPECGSELEAVEKHKEVVERRIHRKLDSNICAMADIEMHSVLELCRIELINKQRKEG